MAELYDLILIDINIESSKRTAAISNIAKLLQVDVGQIAYLLENQRSAPIKQGITLDIARKYQAALARLGGNCDYRLAQNGKNGFELAPVEIPHEKVVFTCPACEYKHSVDSEEELPTACPECGVIPSKYEKVSYYKQERAKIRKHMAHAHTLYDQQNKEYLVQRENEARRLKLLEEARQRLGLPRAINNKYKIYSLAMLILLLGVAMGGFGASAYYDIHYQIDGVVWQLWQTFFIPNKT